MADTGSRMPAEKFNPDLILLANIGQDCAIVKVPSILLEFGNLAYKIRPILPRPRDANYHFPIHRRKLAEKTVSLGFKMACRTTETYLPSLSTSSRSTPSRTIPIFSITRPDPGFPTK